jgi:hypothetical protein
VTPDAKPLGATIRSAVDRGIGRLADLAPDGHWIGFPTLAGSSDVWVTAFVVTHLAPLGRRTALLTDARRHVVRQRGEEGWGYSSAVPADADSTAWCLLALRRSRLLGSDPRRESEQFLLDHADEFGGVCTYLPGSSIRSFIGAGSTSMAGWTSAHPDVTAVGLLTDAYAPGSNEALRSLQWLVGQQDRAGLLPAYWWRPRFYTTAMALRACRRHGVRPGRLFERRLLERLEAKQLPDGGFGLGASPFPDPFSTALALECMLHLSSFDPDRRAAAVVALIDAQQRDGGWRGDLVLRIPAPSEPDPTRVQAWTTGTGGGNSYNLDLDGVFATVMTCHVLHLVASGEDALLGADLPVLDEPAVEIDQTIAEIPNPLPETAEVCGPGSG